MTGAVAFGSLILAAALAGRYGRPGAVLLALCAVGSLFLNRSMEGRTIYKFSQTHALVAGDLVALGAFLLAILLFVFPRRN